MSDNIKRAIGSRIRAARMAKKLTQEQLAELIGKSVQTVSSLERGKSLPALDTLATLAQALDTPQHLLLATPAANSRREQKEFEGLLILRGLSNADLNLAITQLRAIAERER